MTAYGVGKGIGTLIPFAIVALVIVWMTGGFDRPREPSAMDNCLETARLVSGHAPSQADVDYCVAAAR